MNCGPPHSTQLTGRRSQLITHNSISTMYDSGHGELSFYFFLIFSCFAPAQQRTVYIQHMIIYNFNTFWRGTFLLQFRNCLLITNLFITLPHSRVLSVLDHVFGSYFQNQERWPTS